MSPPEATSCLSYAAILAGAAGSWFLAATHLFEHTRSHAAAQNRHATMAVLEGINPDADFARAWATVDNRLGFLLILLGAVAQGLATAGVEVEPVVAFEPFLLALFAALAIREPCNSARERTLFRAKMLSRDTAKFRYDVYCAYQSALSFRGRSINEFQPAIDKVTAELGRRPWDELGLPAA